MTEIYTIDRGKKDALLRKDNIKKTFSISFSSFVLLSLRPQKVNIKNISTASNLFQLKTIKSLITGGSKLQDL